MSKIDLDELERLAKASLASTIVALPPSTLLDLIAEVRAAREKTPQPDADNWIPWSGGDCPLPAGTRHEVRFCDGETVIESMTPEVFDWKHTGDSGDIIAYRVL